MPWSTTFWKIYPYHRKGGGNYVKHYFSPGARFFSTVYHDWVLVVRNRGFQVKSTMFMWWVGYLYVIQMIPNYFEATVDEEQQSMSPFNYETLCSKELKEILDMYLIQKKILKQNWRIKRDPRCVSDSEKKILKQNWDND